MIKTIYDHIKDVDKTKLPIVVHLADCSAFMAFDNKALNKIKLCNMDLHNTIVNMSAGKMSSASQLYTIIQYDENEEVEFVVMRAFDKVFMMDDNRPDKPNIENVHRTLSVSDWMELVKDNPQLNDEIDLSSDPSTISPIKILHTVASYL